MPTMKLVSRIENDKYTEYLYDHYDIQNREISESEIPMPSDADLTNLLTNDDWNIFLICGNSGSGKSTILRAIGDINPIDYDYSKASISQFPLLTEEEACDLLSSMGLSSVPSWLRKPNELSTGERARLDIAKALYEGGDFVLIDEFTSVINRSAAKSLSFALQRYVRNKNKKVIIASCHYDVIEWLRPDYVFNLQHMDENGEVDMDKIVYSDSIDYNAYQSIAAKDTLSDAYALS